MSAYTLLATNSFKTSVILISLGGERSGVEGVRGEGGRRHFGASARRHNSTATDVTPEGQGGGIFDAPATLIILASDVNLVFFSEF